MTVNCILLIQLFLAEDKLQCEMVSWLPSSGKVTSSASPQEKNNQEKWPATSSAGKTTLPVPVQYFSASTIASAAAWSGSDGSSLHLDTV